MDKLYLIYWSLSLSKLNRLFLFGGFNFNFFYFHLGLLLLLLFLLLTLLGLLFLLLIILWLFLLLVRQEVLADELAKHLRYSKSFFFLIVFKDTAQSTLSCAKCSIQHMNILFLSFLNIRIVTSFFFEPHLIPRFLDWKSVQFEHETSYL